MEFAQQVVADGGIEAEGNTGGRRAPVEKKFLLPTKSSSCFRKSSKAVAKNEY